MSRSNPTVNAPNPAFRFFEWDGAEGHPRYYDKEKKENNPIKLPFTFLLLDELATIRGWCDDADSGLYSNEVRDTRSDVLVVKTFGNKEHRIPARTIATGVYQDIKDKVVASGGHFTANCYIACKFGNDLKLCAIQFKGAALNAWVELRRAHGAEMWKQAIKITGAKEGKKGKITFQTPVFEIQALSEETNKEALEIDQKILQPYLTAYLARPVAGRVNGMTASDPSVTQPDENYDADRKSVV